MTEIQTGFTLRMFFVLSCIWPLLLLADRTERNDPFSNVDRLQLEPIPNGRNQQAFTPDEQAAIAAILTRGARISIDTIIANNPDELNERTLDLLRRLATLEGKLKDKESLDQVLQRLVGDFSFDRPRIANAGRRLGAPLPANLSVTNPNDPRPFSVFFEPNGTLKPRADYWNPSHWQYEPTPEQLGTVLANEFAVLSAMRNLRGCNLPPWAIQPNDHERLGQYVNHVITVTEKKPDLVSTFAHEIAENNHILSRFHERIRISNSGQINTQARSRALLIEVLRIKSLNALNRSHSEIIDPIPFFLDAQINGLHSFDHKTALDYFLNTQFSSPGTSAQRAPNQNGRDSLYSINEIKNYIRQSTVLQDKQKALGLAELASRGHTITADELNFIGSQFQHFVHLFNQSSHSKNTALSNDFLTSFEPALRLQLIKAFEYASSNFSPEQKNKWDLFKTDILNHETFLNSAHSGLYRANGGESYSEIVQFVHSKEHETTDVPGRLGICIKNALQ